MNVIVAIPKFEDVVAPCFEAAGTFQIADIRGREVYSRRHITGLPGEGFRQVRILQIHKVETLICNGIKRFYLDMLAAQGMTVIPNRTGEIEAIIGEYLGGGLDRYEYRSAVPAIAPEIPHDILLRWTRELFECYGYRVGPGPGPDAALIDLVAEIDCPVCGRPIRVAVCCGAHTYRSDLEIREFHHGTPDSYHARVYVHPQSEQVSHYCREYGIEHIDPNPIDYAEIKAAGERSVPILSGAIRGHEKLAIGDRVEGEAE